MENSSKALIIVGEVLIAIIILSILTAVIVSFGRYSSDTHKKIADQETYQFNSNFLSYSGRVNITAQEIATIINFAKKENDKNDLSRKNNENSEMYIDILIDDKSFFKNMTTDNEYNDNINFSNHVSKFIETNNTTYFRCQATAKKSNKMINGVYEITTTFANDKDIDYNNQRRVNKIVFHKITNYKVVDPIHVK